MMTSRRVAALLLASLIGISLNSSSRSERPDKRRASTFITFRQRPSQRPTREEMFKAASRRLGRQQPR